MRTRELAVALLIYWRETATALDASPQTRSFARMDYVAELRSTIRRLHQCDAAHSRTETVKSVVNGQVLWDGAVEVFALLGHDRALRCYAWGHLVEGRWEVTTVLAIPPVISAESAVLAAIAHRIKEHEHDANEATGEG